MLNSMSNLIINNKMDLILQRVSELRDRKQSCESIAKQLSKEFNKSISEQEVRVYFAEIKNSIQRNNHTIKQSYDKIALSSIKREVQKYSNVDRSYDLFIDKLSKVNIKPITLKTNNTQEGNVLNVFFTDTHLWKKWTSEIVNRIEKLTNDIIKSPEKNINLLFGWDIGDLFLPIKEMHPWQRLWCDNYTPEELIMLCVDVLKNMIVKIHKSWKNISFYWLWGNHDRLDQKKEFDPYRTPAMVIFAILRRLLPNVTIKSLREKANNIALDWINVVLIHWDDVSEGEIKRRALNSSFQQWELLFITWDKHHLEINELSNRCIWIKSPALAWVWTYDNNLALTSQPWAIFFKRNNEWLLDIKISRYK